MIRGSFVHVICLVFLLLNVAPSVAHAQSADNVDALNNEVKQLHKQGKYAEAAKIAEHVLSQAETTLGPEHPSTLTSVSNLGKLYLSQGRLSEAETLLKRVLATRRKVLGPAHPDTFASVNDLAMLLCDDGGQVLKAIFHGLFEVEHVTRASVRRRLTPLPEGCMSGIHSPVHLFRGRHRNVGQRLIGGRVAYR